MLVGKVSELYTIFTVLGWSESINKPLKTDFDLLLCCRKTLLPNSTTPKLQENLATSMLHEI